jgi:hypothetical protein
VTTTPRTCIMHRYQPSSIIISLQTCSIRHQAKFGTFGLQHELFRPQNQKIASTSNFIPKTGFGLRVRQFLRFSLVGRVFRFCPFVAPPRIPPPAWLANQMSGSAVDPIDPWFCRQTLGASENNSFVPQSLELTSVSQSTPKN